MIKNRLAVVAGGYTTGKRLLDPVANALCERFHFADAAVFTFPEVITQTERLQKTLEGQPVFAISAGFLAVSKCTGMERVLTFNSPEPVPPLQSLRNAHIKISNLRKAAKAEPNPTAYKRVIASNITQGIRFVVPHLQQMGAVSRFSTAAELTRLESAGVKTARIDTAGCEFFGPNTIQSWDENERRIIVAGCHDQLLIDPIGHVNDIPEQALV